MVFLYGLDDVAEAEAVSGSTMLALQAAGDGIPIRVGNTLINVQGDGQAERHLWNVVMALVRAVRAEGKEPALLGLEGREGPQGLDLLAHIDEELYRRLADETDTHPPIIAIFPCVDGLPEDYASTFQTLVLKSERVNIHVVTTALNPGLLPMFFTNHITVEDPDGYQGVLVGKHDEGDRTVIAPHFERQDINRFKKSLGKAPKGHDPGDA